MTCPVFRGVALLLVMAVPAQELCANGGASPALAGAKSYVEAIYRSIPARFDYGMVHYAPELSALMKRDAVFSKVPGDVGVLDGIPFCDCQDSDPNYRILRTRMTAFRRVGATVIVDLRNGGVRRFSVDLVPARGRWLVQDVHSSNVPSLLALMRREVPLEERDLRLRHKRAPDI